MCILYRPNPQAVNSFELTPFPELFVEVQAPVRAEHNLNRFTP